MLIYLGSDHAGFNLKKELKEYLTEKYKGDEDSKVLDLGVFTNDSTDYLDIEREVSEKIVENPGSIGIVFSSSGPDVCDLVNKMPGLNAVYIDKAETKLDLSHNFLCFPARLTDIELMKKAVDEFTVIKR